LNEGMKGTWDERAKLLGTLTGTTGKGVSFGQDVAHVFAYVGVSPLQLVIGHKETARERFERTQSEMVHQLNDLDENLKTKADAISASARRRTFLDTSRATWDRSIAQAEGRQREADLIALDEWKKNGQQLAQLNPGMYGDLFGRG